MIGSRAAPRRNSLSLFLPRSLQPGLERVCGFGLKSYHWFWLQKYGYANKDPSMRVYNISILRKFVWLGMGT